MTDWHVSYSEPDDVESSVHKGMTITFYTFAFAALWYAGKSGFSGIFNFWSCVALMMAYAQFHIPSFCGSTASGGSTIRSGLDDHDVSQPIPFLRPANVYSPCPQGLFEIQAIDPWYPGDVYYYMGPIAVMIYYYVRGFSLGWCAVFMAILSFLVFTIFYGVYYTSTSYEGFQWGDSLIIGMYLTMTTLWFLVWLIPSKRCFRPACMGIKRLLHWETNLDALRTWTIAMAGRSKYNDVYLSYDKFEVTKSRRDQDKTDRADMENAGKCSRFCFFGCPRVCWGKMCRRNLSEIDIQDYRRSIHVRMFNDQQLAGQSGCCSRKCLGCCPRLLWLTFCVCGKQKQDLEQRNAYKNKHDSDSKDGNDDAEELLSNDYESGDDDDDEYQDEERAGVKRTWKSWEDERDAIASMLKSTNRGHPLRKAINRHAMFFTINSCTVIFTYVLFVVLMALLNHERTVPTSDLNVIIMHDSTHILIVAILFLMTYAIDVENVITQDFKALSRACRNALPPPTMPVLPHEKRVPPPSKLQVQMAHFSMDADTSGDEEEGEEEEAKKPPSSSSTSNPPLPIKRSAPSSAPRSSLSPPSPPPQSSLQNPQTANKPKSTSSQLSPPPHAPPLPTSPLNGPAEEVNDDEEEDDDDDNNIYEQDVRPPPPQPKKTEHQLKLIDQLKSALRGTTTTTTKPTTENGTSRTTPQQEPETEHQLEDDAEEGAKEEDDSL